MKKAIRSEEKKNKRDTCDFRVNFLFFNLRRIFTPETDVELGNTGKHLRDRVEG
jgi:hypothetical protein